MECLGSIDQAERQVLHDATSLIKQLHELSENDPDSPVEAVEILAEIRDVTYENLNQLQHEYLLLQAARFLLNEGHVPPGTEWFWNPRQTGGANEPDLEGSFAGEIWVSVEATTSKRPVGTIAEYMKSTLRKLATFEGNRLYFVRSRAMKKRAETYVENEKLSVTVVNLSE